MAVSTTELTESSRPSGRVHRAPSGRANGLLGTPPPPHPTRRAGDRGGPSAPATVPARAAVAPLSGDTDFYLGQSRALLEGLRRALG